MAAPSPASTAGWVSPSVPPRIRASAVVPGRFPTADRVREVLRASLANGGRFAELYVEERSSLSTRLDDGKVEELTSGLDRGAGIRVVHGETAAYAYSNRLDRDSLLAVAGAASAAVRGS